MYTLRFKDNIKQLRDIFKAFLPENKSEISVFLFFFLLYLSYSILIAVNTSVIDYKDLLYDVYFSFDNPIIYRQGYVYLEGHPLMMFMTMPFIHIGNILASLWGYKAKTVFLAIICNILISLSTIYVFRYLKKVIGLKGYINYLLILLYGFTATNLILCFTPESFTITAFFLSFTIYFYSYYIKKNKAIRLASNTFFAVILGGITITNFVKGIIPILFSSNNKKVIFRKIVLVGAIFSTIIIWMQIQYDFIDLIQNRLAGNISVPARGNYFEKLFEWLYAGPIFFPEIMILEIKIDGLPFGAISVDFYHHWWQYLFAVSLFIILMSSAYINRRNKLVQLILLCLLVDVCIHGIIRYGIRDAFIYGGHWVLFVPLLIGWGYQAIITKRTKSYAKIILTLLLVMMILNNTIQLASFIKLALTNFQPYTL